MIGSLRRHILYRIMALTVCLTFISQSIGPVAGAESAYKPSLSSGSSSIDIASVKIPANIGEVIDSSKGSIDKTVIHIRDAHCDYSAQSSISGLIGYLHDNYVVDLVALEGGSGDYDLSVFTDIKDTTLREKVADYFVRQGEVNGAESYALNNPAKVILYGIEEPSLYVENLNAYRNSLKFKDKAIAILKSMALDISKDKNRIYPADFRELDKKMRLFKEEKIGFEEYASAIAAYAKKNSIDMSKYPNIGKFYEAVDSENGVNMKEAERDRNILIDMLNKRLPRKYLEELVAKTVAFNDEEIPASEYYPYLLAKAELCGIGLDNMPNLIKYTHTTKKANDVNKKSLEREFKALEEKMCSTFLKTDEERSLRALDRKVFILDRLFSIGLVKDDWDYYIAHRDEFDTKEFASLNDYRQDMEKFYELSLKRDDIFLKIIAGKLNKEKQKNIILVTGGFHQDNLKKLFQDKGYSYVEVLPKIEKTEGENPYFRLLSGGMDPITKAISEKQSSLQIASYLSAKLGVQNREVFDRAVKVVAGLIKDGAYTDEANPSLKFSLSEFDNSEALIVNNEQVKVSGKDVYVSKGIAKSAASAVITTPVPKLEVPKPIVPAAPAAENLRIQRPIVDCSIDRKKAEEWINAYEKRKDLQELAKFIVDNITYVDQETFEKALSQAVTKFNKECIRPFGVCLLGALSNETDEEMKSNAWAYRIAREKELPEPKGVVHSVSPSDAADQLKDWLLSNPGVNDILFIDDASYSGKQLNDWLQFALMNIFQDEGLKSRPITIHIAIPYMTNNAKAMAHASAKYVRDMPGCNIEVKLYDQMIIPTVNEIFDKATPSNREKLMADMQKIYGRGSLKKTLFYFQHKQPDYYSVIYASPTEGTVLEGPVVNENGEIIRKIPFIPVIGKAPYQKGYLEWVEEHIKRSKWSNRINPLITPRLGSITAMTQAAPAAPAVAQTREYERIDTTRRAAVNRIVDTIKSHEDLRMNVDKIAKKIRDRGELTEEEANVIKTICQRLEQRSPLITLSRKVRKGDRVVTFSQQNIKLLNSTLGTSQTDEIIERRHRVLKLLLRRARLIGPKNEGVLQFSYKQDKFVIKEEVLKRLGLEETTKKLNKISETLKAIMNKYIKEKNVSLENPFSAYYGLSDNVKEEKDDDLILADIQALQASKLARRASDAAQLELVGGQPEPVYGTIFDKGEFDILIKNAQNITNDLGIVPASFDDPKFIEDMKFVRSKSEKELKELKDKEDDGSKKERLDRLLKLKIILDIYNMFDFLWPGNPDIRETDKIKILRLLEILENVGARAPPNQTAEESAEAAEKTAKAIEEALLILETNTKNPGITSGNAFHYYAFKRSQVNSKEPGRIVSVDAIGFWADIQKNLAKACENYLAGKNIVDECLAADSKVKKMMKQNVDNLIKILDRNGGLIKESDKVLMYQEGGDEIAFYVLEEFKLSELVNAVPGVRLIAAKIKHDDKKPRDDVAFALGYTEVTHAPYGDAYISSQESDKKAKDLETLGISAVVSEEIDDQNNLEVVVYHMKGDSVVRESYEEAIKSAPVALAEPGANAANSYMANKIRNNAAWYAKVGLWLLSPVTFFHELFHYILGMLFGQELGSFRPVWGSVDGIRGPPALWGGVIGNFVGSMAYLGAILLLQPFQTQFPILVSILSLILLTYYAISVISIPLEFLPEGDLSKSAISIEGVLAKIAGGQVEAKNVQSLLELYDVSSSSLVEDRISSMGALEKNMIFYSLFNFLNPVKPNEASDEIKDRAKTLHLTMLTKELKDTYRAVQNSIQNNPLLPKSKTTIAESKVKLFTLFNGVAAIAKKKSGPEARFNAAIYPASGSDITAVASFADEFVTIDSNNLFQIEKHNEEFFLEKLENKLLEGMHATKVQQTMADYVMELWLLGVRPDSIKVISDGVFSNTLQYDGTYGDMPRITTVEFEIENDGIIRKIRHTHIWYSIKKEEVLSPSVNDILKSAMNKGNVLILSKAGGTTPSYSDYPALRIFEIAPAGTIFVSDSLSEIEGLQGCADLTPSVQEDISGLQKIGLQYGYAEDFSNLRIMRKESPPVEVKNEVMPLSAKPAAPAAPKVSGAPERYYDHNRGWHNPSLEFEKLINTLKSWNSKHVNEDLRGNTIAITLTEICDLLSKNPELIINIEQFKVIVKTTLAYKYMPYWLDRSRRSVGRMWQAMNGSGPLSDEESVNILEILSEASRDKNSIGRVVIDEMAMDKAGFMKLRGLYDKPNVREHFAKFIHLGIQDDLPGVRKIAAEALKVDNSLIPIILKCFDKESAGFALNRRGTEDTEIVHGDIKQYESRAPALYNLLSNEENLRQLLLFLSILRLIYPYEINDKNADSPFEYARNNKLYFRLDPNSNVYVTPVTESFRRHVVFTMDENGNAGNAVELKIPGRIKAKWKVSEGNFTISELLWKCYPKDRPCPEAKAFLRLSRNSRPLNMYGKPPFDNSVNTMVYSYNLNEEGGNEKEDGKRLSNFLYSSRLSGKELRDVAVQCNLLLAEFHALGFVAEEDMNKGNFRVINKKDGKIRVIFAGDFETVPDISGRLNIRKQELSKVNSFWGDRKISEDMQDFYNKKYDEVKGRIEIIINGLIDFLKNRGETGIDKYDERLMQLVRRIYAAQQSVGGKVKVDLRGIDESLGIKEDDAEALGRMGMESASIAAPAAPVASEKQISGPGSGIGGLTVAPAATATKLQGIILDPGEEELAADMVARINKDNRERLRAEIENSGSIENINKEKLKELTNLGPDGVNVIRSFLNQDNWFQTDRSDVAAVIGGGKPCASISMTEAGKEFIKRPEIISTLESLGIAWVVSEEPRPNWPEELYSAYIYNVKDVRNIINSNKDFLNNALKDTSITVKTGMSLDEIKNFIRALDGNDKHKYLCGILIGYPKRAVELFGEREALGEASEKWIDLGVVIGQIMNDSNLSNQEFEQLYAFAGFGVDFGSIDEGIKLVLASNTGCNTTMAVLTAAPAAPANEEITTKSALTDLAQKVPPMPVQSITPVLSSTGALSPAQAPLIVAESTVSTQVAMPLTPIPIPGPGPRMVGPQGAITTYDKIAKDISGKVATMGDVLNSVFKGDEYRVIVSGAVPTNDEGAADGTFIPSGKTLQEKIAANRYLNERLNMGIYLAHTTGLEEAKKEIKKIEKEKDTVAQELVSYTISAFLLSQLENDQAFKKELGLTDTIENFLRAHTVLDVVIDFKPERGNNIVYLMPYFEATGVGLSRLNLINRIKKSEAKGADPAKDEECVKAFENFCRAATLLTGRDLSGQFAEAMKGQNMLTFFKTYDIKLLIPAISPIDLNDLRKAMDAMKEAWHSL